MLPPTPRSTLSPYTTLFRSGLLRGLRRPVRARDAHGAAGRAGPRLRQGREIAVLPAAAQRRAARLRGPAYAALLRGAPHPGDRKSTRLNSSHVEISYAVFCL